MTKKLQVGVKGFIQYQNKFLLLRNNNNKYSNYQTASNRTGYTQESWSIPGGRINIGEDIETNLFREIEEETGLKKTDLELKRLLTAQDIIKEEIHVIRLTYLLNKLNDEIDIKLSNEHLGFNWLTLEELLKERNNLDVYLLDVIKLI